MSHLEAASIEAFRDLAGALAAMGAPRALCHAADRAAQDERRHATVTGRFARRFGGTPRRPCVATASPPTLEELLADDAVEGCVGESYGALVAMWQAERAGDPDVARAMRRIAQDEASHAVLAWRVLRWGAPLLDEQGRRKVRACIDRALELLHASAQAHVDPSVIDQAGHPSPDAGRALVGLFAQFVRENSDVALRPVSRRSRRLPGRTKPTQKLH
jgi:hypothetical protein